MILVHGLAAGGVNRALGRADDKLSGRTKHSFDFLHEARVFANMLQRFKRHHGVDRGVAERQIERAALDEAQVLPAVSCAGMSYCCRIEVRSDDAPGDIREDRRAVAFTRCDIEHVEPRAQIASQTVAMEMLELDLAFDRSRHAFASELHRSFWERHFENSIGSIRLERMISGHWKPMLNGIFASSRFFARQPSRSPARQITDIRPKRCSTVRGRPPRE